MRLLRLAAPGILLSLSTVASAQGTGVSAKVGLGQAIANEQKRELGSGPMGSLAAQQWFVPQFAMQLEANVLGLEAGEGPSDPRLEARKSAGLTGGTLGFVVRPFGARYDGSATHPSGLFFDAGGGATRTGKLTRPLFTAHVGHDFWFGEGFGLGPAVGIWWVPQPNDAIRPDDAVVGVVAVHGTFYPRKTVAAPADPGDPDRDYDGIPDKRDACPDVAEDRDGFEDEDGCPEPDNDKDGVLDDADKCPNEAEDKDGFEDDDGCPDPDDDQDGIPDTKDKCKGEPEDFDGFEDEDGCPDPDNDKDGIPDLNDKCPNEAEDKNGYADDDGCPDAENIRVVGDQIVLDELVYFKLQSATIQARSFNLLSRLAKLINAHPEYKSVSIEGHADETGPDDFNQKLSQGRANAVRDKLVGYGVAASRLTAIGYGDTRPIEEGHTHKAWQKNRRVELRIQREKRVVVDPKTGKQEAL